MQTDSLEGSAVSLDDSSKSNLDSLVQTAKNLLNEAVSERDFNTGDLVSIPTGETNGEALRRCMLLILLQYLIQIRDKFHFLKCIFLLIRDCHQLLLSPHAFR